MDFQIFRKRDNCDNEPEEIFFTTKGEAFVCINSMRKKYIKKPSPVEHLTSGQFYHCYGNYNKWTKCNEQKKQELVANNGILGTSIIPL